VQDLKFRSSCFGLVAVLVVSVAVTRPSPAQATADSLTRLITSPTPQPISVAIASLTSEDYRWIGQRIYANECASDPRYLTYWGKGEAFPSFGIGHFIWFPAGIDPPFIESFPDMVAFVSRQVAPPLWLQQLQPLHAPWQSKSQFEQAWSGRELTELRDWLLKTQSQQAQFIVQAFETRWLNRLSALAREEQIRLSHKLSLLMASKEGTFAAIDYFNFKGIGGNAEEQYQNEEWGLISVLRQMPAPQKTTLSSKQMVQQFVKAAKQRLTLRTQLAPKERNEQRWLKGWFKRLDGYWLEDPAVNP